MIAGICLVLAAVIPGMFSVWKTPKPELQNERQEPDLIETPGQPSLDLRPGTVKLNPKDGLEYIWIPPGTFQMGCVPEDHLCRESESPRHKVTISSGFWISRHPITVSSYNRFVVDTGRDMPDTPTSNRQWTKVQHPIVYVNWFDAQAFCEWTGGWLPTEAQWEYAARGGRQDLKYPWGGEITDQNANYKRDRRWQGTSPVARFPPNALGLYDVAGNVWEWCSDWWGEDYSSFLRARDPQGPSGGSVKIARGGSWGSGPAELRVSARARFPPAHGVIDVGFRCALYALRAAPAKNPDKQTARLTLHKVFLEDFSDPNGALSVGFAPRKLERPDGSSIMIEARLHIDT